VSASAGHPFWTVVSWGVGVPFVLAFYGNIVLAFVLGRQSTRWPSAEGVLDWFAMEPGARGFSLSVRYRYRVGDAEYVGTRYRIGDGLVGSSTYPNGTPIEHWRTGMPLVVRYHPRRPRLATIETGVPLGTATLFWMFPVGSTVVGAIRFIAYIFGR
jgi:hypothetical protein